MMWKALLLSSLIFVIQGKLCLSRQPGCPVPEDVYPCRCHNDAIFHWTMKCENISSDEDLRNVFDNSKKYRFNRIVIKDSKLQYLPYNLFEDVEMETLIIEKVSLNKVFDLSPKALRHLKTLSIKAIRVRRGSIWEILQPIKSLRNLFVNLIPMKTVGHDFSQSATEDLEVINFSKTETETIEPGTFDKFKKLQKLSFGDGSITKLTRHIFPTPFYVRELSFDHQKLNVIQEGLFSSMPNLRTLSLIDNQIATIPEDAFDSFQLSILMLDDNPIKCDCRFKWLLYKRVILTGTCASPKWLHGKRLDHLSKGYFQC